MRVFVRAVITGFGFSLGKELYRRLSKKLGIDSEDEPESASSPPPVADLRNDDEAKSPATAPS